MPDFVLDAPPCLAALALLLVVPGFVLIPRSTTALPATFVRILVSAIATTLLATLLAALERFSLPTLLGCLAALSVVAFVFRFRRAAAPDPAEPPAAPDRVGPVVFVLALLAFWPGYPSFLGTSDSTTYLGSGVSLARHGTLALEDPLGPQIPLPFREKLFDSMSQVFDTPGPPYRRMPGGILIDDLAATRAWPAFFPVPSVWSAVLAKTGELGGMGLATAAPAFAPLFGALALWAFWLLARAWMPAVPALAAVVLLGASAPFFTASRMPLSEPIAAFFVLSGLAALASAAGSSRAHDAAIAGAALGAAVFTRIEIGLLLALAFCLAPALAGRRRTGGGGPAAAFGPRLPVLLAWLLAVGSLTVVPAWMVPGTWISPLTDHLRNARIHIILAYGWPSLTALATAAGVLVVLVVVLARRVGWAPVIGWGSLAAAMICHAMAANYLAERTPMWLSFSIGWSGLALAAVGALLAFRNRWSLPAAPLVLALGLSTAAILFYNPHVYPALPWGARRFVPILLPLLVLLGCYTAAQLAQRSRLAALACVALLAWPVYGGGRPIWQRTLVEGAYEALQQLEAALPKDGTVFVDRELSPMMVGPALWLVHDRIAINVPPTSSKGGNDLLPPLVWHFGAKGPVYLVTRGAGAQTRLRTVAMTLLARVPLGLPFLEQTYNRRPETIQRYLMPLAIYRLDRSIEPKGSVQ